MTIGRVLIDDRTGGGRQTAFLANEKLNPLKTLATVVAMAIHKALFGTGSPAVDTNYMCNKCADKKTEPNFGKSDETRAR